MNGQYRTVPVLDHGFVRLADCMGGDLSVVRAARNSHDAAWRAGADEGSDERLLKYLLRNVHSTPFEAVTFTFEVKAPIFVFRQWHRHRTWSYNEVSARYTELEDEFYVPEPMHVGTQSKASKQGRVIGAEYSPDARQEQCEIFRTMMERSFALYRGLLDVGWPRELARTVLPVGTYSKMFATVNLWNLFRFIDLRSHVHAQYEIQCYAKALEDVIVHVVPVIMKVRKELKGETA